MPHELDSLTDRIHGLLVRIDGGHGPDRARLEHTLTDGYACALALDAECDRLELRISERAAGLGADGTAEEARELSALASRLNHRRRELQGLRDLLAALRAGVQQARVA